jgi:hypothetical protein
MRQILLSSRPPYHYNEILFQTSDQASEISLQ